MERKMNEKLKSKINRALSKHRDESLGKLISNFEMSSYGDENEDFNIL
jgi:hypothetical protein